MKFSDLSPAEKVEHIWIYYKFHILGGAFLLFLVIYFVSTMTGRLPSVLNVEVVSGNILPGTTAAWQQKATAALVPPGQRASVQISSLPLSGTLDSPQNANALMALSAMIAARNIDVMVLDQSDFRNLSGHGYFENLRQMGLPASILDKHALVAPAGLSADKPIYGLAFPRSLAARFGVQSFGTNVIAVLRNAQNMQEAGRFLEWLWR